MVCLHLLIGAISLSWMQFFGAASGSSAKSRFERPRSMVLPIRIQFQASGGSLSRRPWPGLSLYANRAESIDTWFRARRPEILGTSRPFGTPCALPPACMLATKTGPGQAPLTFGRESEVKQ